MENKGAEPSFAPRCLALEEVMALTTRLGCHLSGKLLWREEKPGGDAGFSSEGQQSSPLSPEWTLPAQAGVRVPPGVLEA